MYEDNARNSQGTIPPFLLRSNSSEGGMYYDMEGYFLENKFPSKEFQLQYNRSFEPIRDSKFNIMIAKTNQRNLFKKTEDILHSLDDQTIIITNDIYKKMGELLIDMMQITNNPPAEKEDYTRALLFQSRLVDKMIGFIEPKLSSEH